MPHLLLLRLSAVVQNVTKKSRHEEKKPLNLNSSSPCQKTTSVLLTPNSVYNTYFLKVLSQLAT